MTAPEESPKRVLEELVSPAGRGDPYPFYERLRAYGQVVEIRPGLLVSLGYEESSAALRNPQWRVQDADSYDRVHPDWREHSSLRAYTDSMLYRNPPSHARLRRLVSAGFTPRRVADLQPAVEQMTDRLLRQLAETATAGIPVDFIGEFASRLPIAVISNLLGVPEEDHAWFRTIAGEVTLALEGYVDPDGLAPADAAMDELAAYFLALIEHRRRHPAADDVVSVLVRHHGADDRLTQDELIGNMMLMLTAGFETTSFLLGHGLELALADPRHARRLRDEPQFAASFAEELLRFEAPVQATSRWSHAELELAGDPVPAGTKLLVILGAANRDPRRYHRPDTFDPDRRDVQPLTFGAGGHFCLGAPLARMEARIALPRLLRAFPDIHAVGDPVRRDTWVGRGFDNFPVMLA